MSIARSAASGAAWNLSTGVLVRVLGLVGSLILTRFLAPAEFGEVSVAAVTVMIAGRLASFGLGPYVIAHQSEPSEAFQAQVFHTLAVGVACMAVVLIREPLGVALGSPDMARFVPPLALAVFLLQLSHIPASTLIRALRFRSVALTRAAGEVVYTVASVGLAPLIGAGAIVAGNLVRALLVSTIFLLRANAAEWLHPVRPRWRTLRRMLGFGLPLNGTALTDTLATSVDNLLVSRLYGPGVMGEYNLSYNLATTPTSQVAERIGDVLLPSFAMMDEGQRRGTLGRAAGLMALVIFPLAAGLVVVAPTTVRTLLDPRWAGVAPMLAILAALNLPNPLTWVVGSYFAAIRRTRPFFFLGLLKLGAIFGLVLTLGQAGPLWACLAVAVAFQLHGLLAVAVGWKLGGLRPFPLVLATLGPLAASLLMGAVVLAFRAVLPGGVASSWVALPLEVGVGACAYVSAAAVVARGTALEFVRLARGAVRGNHDDSSV